MPVLDYMPGLRAALWAEIGAGCPAVLPANGGGGILRARRARRMALETVLTEFGLPYAVVDFGEGSLSPRAPADDSLYRHRTDIYVVSRSAEDEDALWALLGGLRIRFENEIGAHNMATGHVVEVLGADATWYLPPTATVTAKQLDITCGRLPLVIDAGNVLA